MKKARILVLAVALIAGVGAALMVGGSKPTEHPVVAVRPAPVQTDAVLVAAREMNLGAVVSDADMRWQDWPKNVGPSNLIRKSETPNAMEELKGSSVRGNFSVGDPLRRDKLVKGPNAGFMSAVLPAGMRAVAINIDAQGATSAGGFILPNDHVDVIRTYRDESAAKAGGTDVYASETILSNIRVLAIGQNIQEKNNQPVVVGSNATLELTPHQAELIVLAQRIGQLSLVLRSMADSQVSDVVPAVSQQRPQSMTIVRFGVPTQAAAH